MWVLLAIIAGAALLRMASWCGAMRDSGPRNRPRRRKRRDAPSEPSHTKLPLLSAGKREGRLFPERHPRLEATGVVAPGWSAAQRPRFLHIWQDQGVLR
jgi:hypothetical protein